MVTRIELGDTTVDVIRKNIKNIHLSVHPPTGRVRIAAPARLDLDTIRVFAITKLDWIRMQQQKLRAQERETPREYLDRESHYVWGKRYLLKVIEKDAAPIVELTQKKMLFQIRPETRNERKRAILEEWYREQIKEAVPPLIEKWEPAMDVKVQRFFVQRMKTIWGSCSLNSQSIRLNTELAKKPPECLEYIVVHEMAHLLERHHNDRFMAILDRIMPPWRTYRDALNRAPLVHEQWKY